MSHPRRPIKLVLVNSYSMQTAFDLWTAGTSQSHHVWGTTALPEATFSVCYDNATERHTRLDRLWRLFGLNRNNRIQLRVARQHADADIVYAATYSVARLLGILHWLGLFKPKVVALVHFSFGRNWIDRLALAGIDRVLFLSRLAQNDVTQAYPNISARTAYMGWAVDLAFYDRLLSTNDTAGMVDRNPTLRLISAGKDNRDHDTLLDAFDGWAADVQLDIFGSCKRSPSASEVRIKVVSAGAHANPLSIQDLMAHYRHADVILIPMHAVKRVAGLTSLLDALALGKPVLCTRNEGLDIDIEAIGCGYWVEPGKAQAWREAITRMINCRDEHRAMGQRGRRFAEQYLSINDYGQELSRQLQSAIHTSGP
jgi:glycosyltransferase involved in cell wall biosynthesis